MFPSNPADRSLANFNTHINPDRPTTASNRVAINRRTQSAFFGIPLHPPALGNGFNGSVIDIYLYFSSNQFTTNELLNSSLLRWRNSSREKPTAQNWERQKVHPTKQRRRPGENLIWEILLTTLAEASSFFFLSGFRFRCEREEAEIDADDAGKGI